MPHKTTGSGIYCIENKVNGKKYIGQAVQIERRIYEHKYHLNLGKDKCLALQRAVSKYGLDSFDFSIIEYCSTDQLNDMEIYYISGYKTNTKGFGYNLSAGGRSGLLGYKHSNETRQRMSEAKKGWVMGDEQREFIRKLHTGKVVTEETRNKISEAISGAKHWAFGTHASEETKQKLRNKKGAEKSYQFGTKKETSSSPYYGVRILRSKGHVYWAAQVKHKGQRFHVGSSKDEVEAARMYDQFVRENGLPNPLNFPV